MFCYLSTKPSLAPAALTLSRCSFVVEAVKATNYVKRDYNKVQQGAGPPRAPTVHTPTRRQLFDKLYLVTSLISDELRIIVF